MDAIFSGVSVPTIVTLFIAVLISTFNAYIRLILFLKYLLIAYNFINFFN